jgi:glucose/mannose transport system substrate-binding protein
MRNLKLRGIAFLVSGIALAGSAMAQKAEVIHWWTSAGESAAIKEFATAFEKAGGTWVDAAVPGGTAARAVIVNRIVGGKPPTAAQFNTSKQFHEFVDEGLLNNLDAVAEKGGWDKILPAPFIKVAKVKGHYYAVPVNIHMPGWFFYSKAVLQKAGVTAEPKTIDEFFAALDKVKASGVVPLALGGQAWQERWLFDVILANVGGKDLYNRFYESKDANVVESADFKKVLTTYKRLKSYVDPASPGRSWNDTTRMVINGKAGFQVMGDWAKGEFALAKQTAGKEYGCFPGFGSASPYFIDGDVFVFPKSGDPEAAKTQQLLATVITSPAAQLAFNNKKGSIPIRADVEASGMDICAQIGMKVLKEPSRHLSTPAMLLDPDTFGQISDVITKFWNSDQSVDVTVKALATALKG